MNSYRGTWSVMRFTGFERALRDTAHMLGLRLKIEITNGWITENGRFEVTGPEPDIDRFVSWLNRTVAEFNKA